MKNIKNNSTLRVKLAGLAGVMVGLGIGMMILGLWMTIKSQESHPISAQEPRREKPAVKLGNKLVVFKGPILSPVTIKRIGNPLQNWTSTSYGPEFDEKTTQLIPGGTYHLWARVENPSGIDRSTTIEAELVEKGASSSLSLASSNSSEAVNILIYNYPDDAQTIVAFQNVGAFDRPIMSVYGLITIPAGESRDYLVVFTIGDDVPAGSSMLSLNLR